MENLVQFPVLLLQYDDLQRVGTAIFSPCHERVGHSCGLLQRLGDIRYLKELWTQAGLSWLVKWERLCCQVWRELAVWLYCKTTSIQCPAIQVLWELRSLFSCSSPWLTDLVSCWMAQLDKHCDHLSELITCPSSVPALFPFCYSISRWLVALIDDVPSSHCQCLATTWVDFSPWFLHIQKKTMPFSSKPKQAIQHR